MSQDRRGTIHTRRAMPRSSDVKVSLVSKEADYRAALQQVIADPDNAVAIAQAALEVQQ
jgi:hypothetical protein